MLTNIHIRKMYQQDLSKVYEIEQAVYIVPWSLGIFGDCLRVGYECWVLEENEKIIGYGIMSVKAREAHLMNLCIAPQNQYRGYGKQLLKYLIDIAKKQADYMFLEVRKSNIPAIKLYEKFGFNQIGERKNYYPALNGHEDAIMLALSLLEDELFI